MLNNDIFRILLLRCSAKSFYAFGLTCIRLGRISCDPRFRDIAKQNLCYIEEETLTCDQLGITKRSPNGEEEGLQELWSHDAYLLWRWFIKDGKKHGLEVTYHRPNHELSHVGFWRNGVKHDRELSYGPYGLMYDYYWQDGRREGLQEEYWLSGGLMCRERFQNGVPHGWQENFNRDGVIKNKYYCDNGVFQSGILCISLRQM